MSNNNTKVVTVELDQVTFDKFKEYCDDTNTEKSEIMENLIEFFLDECVSNLDSMRKGYEEMGNINLEICSEFESCENEIHNA